MNYFNCLLMATIATLSFPVAAGNLTGEVTLFPEGYQDTPSRICKLKGQLTFVSPRKDSNGKDVIWKTKEWNEFIGKSRNNRRCYNSKASAAIHWKAI